MLARFCSWWQKVNKVRIVAMVTIAVILLALLVLIILGYVFNWPWVGLRGVTFYSWLQLLIIPLVLAIGGFWFNRMQKDREERVAEQRARKEQAEIEARATLEREIAKDNQRAMTLQSYINKMSELLLDKGLRQSQSKEEVRSIGRVLTLTVLFQLDDFRKNTVLQFLHEAGLIEKVQPIVDLSGAFLSGAFLSEANLNEANLTHVRLSKALLGKANLSGADLSESNLSNANLHQADLSGANLSRTSLCQADLSSANLGGANLRSADLSGAFLSGVSLYEAYRSGNDLDEAFLDRIIEADVSGTGVSRVLEADLRGADLSEADLSEAFVTGEQLAQAKSLKGATMPDGTKHS